MKKWLVLSVLFFEFQAFAKPVRLVLNWKPEAEFGGFYTAQIDGLYKKQGLEVQIVPGGAGTPTIQMVAAGQAEFAIVSGEELVLSRSKGTDVTALFAVYQDSPVIIMTHEEDRFRVIKDVFQSSGTLAIQKGLPFYMYLEKKLGKPKGHVVPALGGISSFLLDPHYSQQGFMTSEPLLAAQKNVKTKSFLVSTEGFNPYLTVLVTRGDYLSKNESTVKSLVAAVRGGWASYLNQPASTEQTNQMMHKLNPSMTLEILQKSAEVQKPFIETQETKKKGLGWMTKERWSTLAAQMKNVGLVQSELDVTSWFQNF